MPTIFPELRWAQRSSSTELEKNKLWITVAVANLKDFKVETTDTTFKFVGKDAERDYSLELELFAEIDSKLTRQAGTAQGVVVELRKKEAKTEYWPRLTKDTKRRPFIRTDFDKWVDEDEQEEVPEADPMAGLGGLEGLGGAGGAGESGPGGPGGFDMAQLQALMGQQGGEGGEGGFDMSKLQALQEQMGQQGSAEDDSSDENDETSSNLGKAQN